MQSDYNDYSGVVSRFVAFIKATPIICDFITDCGPCDWDMDETFKEMRQSYGRGTFDLGDTDEEEVRNIYGILCYVVAKNIVVHHTIAEGYTSSNKYQDMIKAFNNRVVMILIRHIETFLTKVGIDMGLDEKVTYSISVHDGQVIIATDNATVNATNTVGFDFAQLATLINNVKESAHNLSDEDAESLTESLEVIEQEAKSGKPRKSFIKTAINGLKVLKGTVEFGSAVAALITFLETVL